MSQWSGEQSVSEYGDLQASAMAVDCKGRWAVLAGRKVLTLVDLDSPTERVTKLTRQSKWDISCVQWHPYPNCGDLFATACNQRLDLFSWDNGNINQKCSMRGHSRTVSDLDWSPFDVNIIASCSVDSYTHLWDIRDPKKPANSFQTVAGASQVKWNKVTNNLFATTHEGDVRLWDPRKGSSPLQYIAAHLSKIHGLDWSPDCETNFATSSQDGTVKFWDTTNPRQNKGSITSGSPVWRARYTPFGHGLITAVVPQLRRGENSLYLWNHENCLQPVHQFVGHQDVILEFEWRKQKEGMKDYHLVTWSKDQSLRIWKIDPHLQKLCGHDVGDLSDSSENENSSLPYETNGSSLPKDQEIGEIQRQMSASPPEIYPGQQPRTLQQEFSMVNVAIDNVRVDELDEEKRTCTVTGISGNNSVQLVIHFSESYPIHGIATFEITESSVNNMVMMRILKVLKDTAYKHSRRNCLEPLLRAFATTLETLSFQTEERTTPDTEALPPFPSFYLPYSRIGSVQDFNIPFPRTSGARFCSAGYLVVFGRSKEAKKGPDFTPKAMSHLNSLVQKTKLRSAPNVPYNYAFSRSPPTTSFGITISNYYYSEIKSGQKSKYRGIGKKLSNDNRETENKKPNIAPVKVYDSSHLLAMNKVLGEQYLINPSDISTMCQHNASMAATIGRKDLVKLWSLVALMADKRLKPSDEPDDGAPWGTNPFGRNLLQSLLKYYIKLRDVQTLAMLCCVFWNRQDPVMRPPPKPQQSISVDYSSTSNYNPYHTISSMSNLVKGLQTLPVANKLADIVSLLKVSPPLSEVSSHPNLPELIQPTNQGVMKLKRSNSYSGFEIDTIDNDFKLDDEVDIKERQTEHDKTCHENNCRMLDPNSSNQYDEYLRCYANILNCWGLQNQSREVMKFVCNTPMEHRGIEFSVYCYKCNAQVRGAQCLSCKYPAFNCAICHLGVKGLSNFCLSCGHGGHTAHLTQWFKSENECPTGCGCQCLKGKIHITLQ